MPVAGWAVTAGWAAPAVGAAANPATVRERAGKATARSLRTLRVRPLGRDSRMGYCLHREVGFLALVGRPVTRVAATTQS
ncbi:hypothetical protein Shyhy01_63770 [Streptomyces hygroscopicus subsp. hygroscopicus]|nr:hypothetical protein Shyhy01_63770 [Streptomyces hygroscopicus subsp. hygroscopicus]